MWYFRISETDGCSMSRLPFCFVSWKPNLDVSCDDEFRLNMIEQNSKEIFSHPRYAFVYKIGSREFRMKCLLYATRCDSSENSMKFEKSIRFQQQPSSELTHVGLLLKIELPINQRNRRFGHFSLVFKWTGIFAILSILTSSSTVSIHLKTKRNSQNSSELAIFSRCCRTSKALAIEMCKTVEIYWQARRSWDDFRVNSMIDWFWKSSRVEPLSGKRPTHVCLGRINYVVKDGFRFLSTRLFVFIQNFRYLANSHLKCSIPESINHSALLFGAVHVLLGATVDRLGCSFNDFINDEIESQRRLYKRKDYRIRCRVKVNNSEINSDDDGFPVKFFR